MSVARRSRSRELSVESASDFFRSASRNIYVVIWLVRIVALGFLYLLFSTIWSILIDEPNGVKETDNVVTMLNVLILFFFVVFLALLTLVVFIAVPLGEIVGGPDVATHYFYAARAYIINNVFGDVTLIEGMDKEGFFGTGEDPLAPMAYLLNKETRAMDPSCTQDCSGYNTAFLYGLILFCLLLMIITGIGFVRKSSVALAGTTLVLSQIIIGLAYMKDLTIVMELDATTISSMLNSNLFQLALISYMYFEFSLQTGYLYSLAAPALSRQRRVGKQLSKLSEFRLGVTKLGTEEEKATEEAKKTRESHQEQEDKTSSALATGTGSTSSKKFSAEALLFLLDSAQDSLFAKPGGEQERLTGRLQRYYDGIRAHDRRMDEKLGGSAGKAFNPFMVLIVVIFSMAFRIFLLIIFAWIALNPSKLLEFIALPQTVTNSIEINEPEGILLVLIPLIFFILGASYLVARAQNWIIKAEELIIKESDISRLLKAGKRITSRKDMEKVQSVIAEQDAKTKEDAQPQKRKRKRKRKAKK